VFVTRGLLGGHIVGDNTLFATSVFISRDYFHQTSDSRPAAMKGTHITKSTNHIPRVSHEQRSRLINLSPVQATARQSSERVGGSCNFYILRTLTILH
jgi:hypothetical protein